MIADLVLEEVSDRHENEILLVGNPRQYRADCHAGQFKIGAANRVGKKLDLELIAARINEGEFFGYPRQKWLNVIFVDGNGVVSTILFKTESLDNFLELHRQTVAAGETLLGKCLQASMSKRSSRENGQGYYAVEFSVAGEGAYSEAIIRFRQETVLEGIYRSLLAKPDTDQAEPQTA